jgi:sporulation protein YlmC with PRC-barrel domain
MGAPTRQLGRRSRDAPSKEFPGMLYDKMMISAAVALVMCTACEQPTQTADRTPQAQEEQAPASDQTTTTDTTAETQTAAIPLSDVENPEQTLVRKQVRDTKGQAIGEVQSVALNADGTVQMVTVKTATNTVAMEASDLKFAQADSTVISEKSKEEIEAPAAQ